MEQLTPEQRRQRDIWLKDIEISVRRHKFKIISMMDDEDPRKSYAYTIGLAEHGYGELLLAGAMGDFNIIPSLLNAVVLSVLENRTKLKDGLRLGSITDRKSPPVRLHRIPDAETVSAIMPLVVDRYAKKIKKCGGKPLEVYQLELADNLNRFAGDEGFLPFYHFHAYSTLLHERYLPYHTEEKK